MIQRKRSGKSDNVIVILSAMLVIQDEWVTSVEGVIDNDVDNSVHNFTRIGKDAMDETNKYVLDIMVKK